MIIMGLGGGKVLVGLFVGSEIFPFGPQYPVTFSKSVSFPV